MHFIYVYLYKILNKYVLVGKYNRSTKQVLPKVKCAQKERKREKEKSTEQKDRKGKKEKPPYPHAKCIGSKSLNPLLNLPKLSIRTFIELLLFSFKGGNTLYLAYQVSALLFMAVGYLLSRSTLFSCFAFLVKTLFSCSF